MRQIVLFKLIRAYITLKIPEIYTQRGSSLRPGLVPTIFKPHATEAWREQRGKILRGKGIVFLSPSFIK